LSVNRLTILQTPYTFHEVFDLVLILAGMSFRRHRFLVRLLRDLADVPNRTFKSS
jgi:hypothetical protein